MVSVPGICGERSLGSSYNGLCFVLQTNEVDYATAHHECSVGNKTLYLAKKYPIAKILKHKLAQTFLRECIQSNLE